ncbi:unnamed protein product [Polarella glacialis]|uniref:Enoyl reductase (ER) domain-containing protein n=2 Tax=Polarella glacialis TaxID=89957 RepID=A0A813IL62_POLGL|nr:unnamed protein product [Polarella glacialis]
MGSDLAGTVLAVEDSCSRLKVGDQVWADIGAVVRFGSTGGGMSKGKENGAYATVAVALESQLGPMPANLGFLEAASLPKVALTSYKALLWYGGAPYSRGNGTVLVLGGSGGTGTTGIQLAKALGASAVITTTSAANAEYVSSLGATHAIDYHSHNWFDVLADSSVDVIYDCVGEAGTGDLAMTKLKSGGFYVTLRSALPSPSKVRSDVTSTAFINSDTNLENLAELEALRRLVEAEQLRMPRVKPFDLSEVLVAFNESRAGRVVGKLVLVLPEPGAEQQQKTV